MTKITRKIEIDKRTKRRITVSTHKTQCILHFDQVDIKMKLPEADRIAKELSIAVEIIQDRKSKKEELRII